MESKKHFKMYKSGKLWVTAAVLGLSVMAGMTVSDQQVKADDQAPVVANTATQPATSQSNATTPSTNNQDANQQVASNDNQGNQQQPAKPTDNQGSQQPAKPADSQDNQQATQKESFKRTVNYLTADGSSEVSAPTTQTTDVNKTVDGDKTTYDVKGAAWESAILPTPEGMHATYNGKPITAVPTEVTLKDGKPDTSAITITFVQNVLGYKKNPTDDEIKQHSDMYRVVTRTINIVDPATKSITSVKQTVIFGRSKTYQPSDGQYKNGDWEIASDATNWPVYTIPQLNYYHTEINGVRGNQFGAKTIGADTPDETDTVTYVSDGTDPYNQHVIPGLNGNWASIDNIYMTDTGIHVTGWNANSESFNRNYHYLIILDYGPNPVVGQFREVGRKLVTGGVSRPDVFKVHQVWNAATSGFDDTVNLDLNQIKTGDKLRILSRWTADPNGNNDPADLVSSYYTMDYNTNVGNLDGMNITNDGQQLQVSGWNATNQVVGRKYHYIILRDATTGQEIGRKLVTDGVNRPDVSNVYKNLLGASESGFKVNFDLTGIDLSHNLQVVSRYSDTLGGEGSNADYWFLARRLINGTTANFANLDGVTADAANGKVNFAGWNATNFSQVEPNHYIILFDTTANQQVDAIKLDSKNGLVVRPDVQRAYKMINGSLNSGFNYSIDMSKLTYGHTYALVSRYSSSADGNGGDGAYTDHWFNNAFTFNQQAYSVDKFTLVPKTTSAEKPAANDKDSQKESQPTTSQDKLHVEGWMASDAAVNYQYAYVIALDAKDGKEFGRSQVTLQDRADVLKAYPTIYNAGKSGIVTDITLQDDMAKKAQTDGVQLVLRYTNDKDGNDKDNNSKVVSADQWTSLYKYDQANKQFVRA